MSKPANPPPANPPAPPPASDPPVPPSYASADEFRSFQAQVSGQLGELSGAFNRVVGMLSRTGDQPRSEPQPIDDVSDEEIENAIAEGKGGSKLIRKAISAGIEKMRREEVGPLRNVGLSSIAKLTRYMATKEMKFYERYKKEIDAAINELPPDARLDPELLVAIHNTIAGRPENIETMIREEREKALREANEPGESGDVLGARRGDSGTRTPPVPSPRELLGDAAADALDAASRTPDRFAQGLGYRDWPHYVDEYRKGLEGEGEGAKGGTA